MRGGRSTASPSAETGPHTRLVAVAGNPNSGKTTLFNALTGLRHKVGNYPGVTVEKREAHLFGDPSVTLIDLPGVYSLTPRSPDEAIARDVLLGRVPGTRRPDAVLVVVDATQLERNLFLATQIIELGLPTVVACNMIDLVESAGHRLDTEALSQRLGVPVVPTVGPRALGINRLREALLSACRRPRETDGQPSRRWRLPSPIEDHVGAVAHALCEARCIEPEAADGTAQLLLSGDGDDLDPSLPAPVRGKVQQVRQRLADEFGDDLSREMVGRRYAWITEVVEGCLARNPTKKTSLTDRLDRILTHRVWGYVCFAAVMALMFYSVFILADPLAEALATGVGYLKAVCARYVPPGVFHDLLRDGVLSGVGAVLVFFPQIAILFLIIALLEDSGYMARGAFLMNRFMSRVGLHGKSFIPLLSAHACAVPSILATRTIDAPRERLVTILVLPFVSCSARLPVYTLLIAACLPIGRVWRAAVLCGLYGLGIGTAFLAAWLIKKGSPHGSSPGFIIELPPYHLPHAKTVLLLVWERCKQFLVRAGTIILAVTVVLWALTSYPRDAERAAFYQARRAALLAESGANGSEAIREALVALDRQEKADNLRHSFAGRLGRVVEPVIRPLGFNWEIGVGLISSFAAREVFVSTMGIVYSVGEADERSASLLGQIRAATWPDGSKLFTPLVAVGLLVYYVLACQCIATLAVVKQETNSWRWPALMFLYMTGLAYLAALLIYQAGTALGL